MVRWIFLLTGSAVLVLWVIWLIFLFLYGVDDDGSPEAVIIFLMQLLGPPVVSAICFALADAFRKF